jgi:subtilisin family serine protease
MKRMILISLALGMMISPGAILAQQQPPTTDKIDPDVIATLAQMRPGDQTTVIVKFKDQADLSRIQGASKRERLARVIAALRAKAQAWPAGIGSLLSAKSTQGKLSRARSFWIFNGVSITGTADTILELAQSPQVETISSDAIDIAPIASAPPEDNVSIIKAPPLWDLGITGQGIVVANVDTGVDYTHQDLAQRWRGGSNSWFDAFGKHAVPTDLNGHGTWTMGVMVGGDRGGSSIGVAPGAQWIAARIFDDTGGSSTTAIHSAYQWLLDPDGNPATDDAPDVVNNSWGFTTGIGTCITTFQNDLKALRAAGILPVFAAGNSGPNAWTSLSPANNPEAFAVGATNNSGVIYSGSSRGPSACNGSVYPALVAPGVLINSTDPGNEYAMATGTSLAAPHASGALALLLSACPGLTPDQQQEALQNSALPLGALSPNNDYGHGALDVDAALNYVRVTGSCNVLVLSCAFQTGQVGIPYSSSLTASAGAPPYEFSITGLPPGLSLNPETGAITGTPATAGSFPYTATVTDSNSVTRTVNCSISIASSLSLACPSGTGRVGQAYASALVASGGLPPYLFSITSGNLPSGLVLNATTGAISGKPTKAGTYNYSAAVSDSAGNTKTASCSIVIDTAPPAANVSPGSLTFSSQLVGTTSTLQTATITNTGSSPLPLPAGSIALAGVNSADFLLTETCPLKLGAGVSCTITVKFRPTATGLRTAQVNVNAGQAKVALTGTGVLGALSLSSSALSFSSPLNVTSAPKMVTVRNTGTAPVTIKGFPLTGTNPGQFKRTHNCPTVLAVNASCTISVTFLPTVASPVVKSAVLTVNAAAPTTDHSITLTGTIIVPAFSVNPSEMNFGNISSPVATSATRTLTVTNKGKAPLVFNGFPISGPNAGQFRRTLVSCQTGAANALMPGDACTIKLIFEPSNPTGYRNAQLNVNVAAPAADKSVLMTGKVI